MLALGPAQPLRSIPYGLVSLRDMINFSLHSFIMSVTALAHLHVRAGTYPRLNERLTEADRAAYADEIQPIAEICRAMGLDAADKRLGRLFTGLRTNTLSYGDLAVEIKFLHQAIVDDAECERFYHYPRVKGLLVLRVPGDWAATLRAFPDSREDIEAAVDCYALGRDRASIHHFMMVLEVGLLALATKLRVKFDVDRSTWAPLIDDIRTAINDELDKLAKPPKGTTPLLAAAHKRRKTFLEACQEAALDMRHFKNVWRDHIAHNRGDYDEHDAKKVLEHVRSFMEIISTKLKLKKIKTS